MSEALHADVVFRAETGQASRDVEELRRQVIGAYSSIDTASLKAQTATDKLDKALGRAGNNAQRQRSAVLSYRREIESISTSSARTAHSVENLERDISKLSRGAIVGTGAMRGLGRAAAFASGYFLGGAGLVYAFRSVIKAGTEQTQILANLRNAVQATGNSWSAYKGQIEQATEATKRQSAFDDDDLYKSLQLLIRGTGDVNKALKLNALAADVARGRNIGLVQSAQLLVRVNAGQVGSLRRLGIQVDKGISGTKALEQVQRQYAGAAAAYMKTAAGAQESLTVAIGDTEKLIGRALLPTVTQYERKLADWLNNTENQKRVQRDANTVIEDASKVIHGLVDAEKLIAPPIQAAVGALGGLENAVQTALVVGLALKAKKAATGIGLIGTASTKARTQVVADAAAEERALAGVAAQAARTSAVVSRIGAYTGAGGVGGAAASGGAAGLIRKYGATIGGPLALSALLYGSTQVGGSTGGNFAGASAYGLGGYVVGGPLGALAGVTGYEIAQGGQALSGYLAGIGTPGIHGAPTLQQLSQAAASGQLSLSALDKIKSVFKLPDQVYQALKQIITAATVYTVTQPSRPYRSNIPAGASGSGTTPGFTSAAQQRAAGLFLHPNDLGLLRGQLGYDENALAFLQKRYAAGKIGGQKYLDELQGLTADRDQIQGRIDAILQASASKAAAAKRKAEAAAKKAKSDAIKARLAAIDAAAPDFEIGGGGNVNLYPGFSSRPILPGRVSGSGSATPLFALYDQQLQNRLSLGQLHQAQAGSNASRTAAAIREQIKAWQAILAQQEKEAKLLTGVAKAQKVGDEIATRQSIAELQNQLKQKTAVTDSARKNERQFLSDAQAIIQTFAPNFNPANTHLYDIKHETRKQTRIHEKAAKNRSAPASDYNVISSLALFG